MNPFSALIGGVASLVGSKDMLLTTADADHYPTHMVTPITHSRKTRAALMAIIFFGIIIITLVVLLINSHAQKEQIKVLNDSLNNYAANTASLLTQTNAIVPIINNIGMRMNNLDKQTTTVVQMITLPNKMGFQGRKSSFTPTGYVAELAFFKTLSHPDQIAYLNMTKEAKRAKYSTLKSN